MIKENINININKIKQVIQITGLILMTLGVMEANPLGAAVTAPAINFPYKFHPLHKESNALMNKVHSISEKVLRWSGVKKANRAARKLEFLLMIK